MTCQQRHAAEVAFHRRETAALAVIEINAEILRSRQSRITTARDRDIAIHSPQITTRQLGAAIFYALLAFFLFLLCIS
jgi:hypothetical protein